MLLTFKDIQDLVLKDCKHSNDTEMRRLVKTWIQHKYFEYMSEIEVPEQWDHSFTFNTEAGKRTYKLPWDFMAAGENVRITAKAGDTDYAGELECKTNDEWNADYPANVSETSAQPHYFRVFKMEGVYESAGDPTNALTAISSSATDAGVRVHAWGYADATRLLPARASAVLTQAAGQPTAVQVALAANMYEVKNVSKEADTVGSVTFKRGTTTIAALAPWQRSCEFAVMELHDTPDDAYTVAVPYRRMGYPMIEDGDTPAFFPREFMMLLVDGVKILGRDWIKDDRLPEAIRQEDVLHHKLLAAHRPYQERALHFTLAE